MGAEDNDSCNLLQDYSDLMPLGQRVVAGLALTIISLAAVTANILLWAAVLYVRKIHKTMHFLLLSLSASDLIVSVFNMPIIAYTIFQGRWMFSCGFCRVTAFTLQVGWVATIMSLASLSINRFLRICHPFWYGCCYSDCLWVHLNATWFFSIFLSLAAIFHNEEFIPRYNKHKFICGTVNDMRNPILQIIFLITGGVMVIVIFCNIRILCTYHTAKIPIRKHSQRPSTKTTLEFQQVLAILRSSFKINKVEPQCKDAASAEAPSEVPITQKTSAARNHFAVAEERTVPKEKPHANGRKTATEDAKNSKTCGGTDQKYAVSKMEAARDKRHGHQHPTTREANPDRDIEGEPMNPDQSGDVSTDGRECSRSSCSGSVRSGTPLSSARGPAKRSEEKLEKWASHDDPGPGVEWARTKKEDVHLVCALTTVVVVFCVAIIPVVTVTILLNSTSLYVPPSVQLFTIILFLANSMCDPIIYGLGNVKIRECYWEVLKKFRKQ